MECWLEFTSHLITWIPIRKADDFNFIIFSFDLDSQPNGGKAENCLTTFIPNGGNSPKWFDRPCVEESDSVGDPGHKFMCECDFPDPLGDTFAQPQLIILSFLYIHKY